MPEPMAPLVWMDLEMSGLDPDEATILEIAVLITDADLNLVAEGPESVIHHPDAVLDSMDDWNREHHKASGLTARVKASDVSLAEAEARVLEFVARHCAERQSPLCGNSIWQDRRFLIRYMPRLEAYLHYRIIDVSSIKELCRRWYPALEIPAKKEAHRALGDILESIEELRFYRAAIFRDA